MTLPRGGLYPVRHVNGGGDFQTTRIRKNGASGADSNLIYVGDPVRLVSGRALRLVAGDTSATGPGVFGVVARILVNEDGRPRVHGLPDQHPNISLSGDQDWLDVYTDPGIVFAGRVTTSATNELIGAGLNIATTARVTAAGISGTQIDPTAVSAGTAPFIGVAVANFDLDGGGSDAGGRIEVMMNFRPGDSLGSN